MADVKQNVRRLAEEAYSKGNLGILEEVCAPKYVGHDPILGKTNLTQFKEGIEMLRKAFPDLKVQMNDYVVENERVIGLWHCTGTQKGEFMGSPPSNKKFAIDGASYSRFDKSGKIVEGHLFYDVLNMAQQIGIIPELGKGAGGRPQPRR